MKPVRILFVEDDPYLGMMVTDLLESRAFAVFYEKTAEKGLELFMREEPDLCVLDVMLPGMDGFELGRRIRSANPFIPIIFLTARSQKDDIIEGYDSGADDYIRKPFHMEELILRINAILRRNSKIVDSGQENLQFEIGKYQFDSQQMKLNFQGESDKLTLKESEMLKIFCENQGKLVEREYILKKVWGDDSYFNTRSMDVFIHKLRARFSQDSGIQILNLRGKGFKLLVGDEPPNT